MVISATSISVGDKRNSPEPTSGHFALLEPQASTHEALVVQQVSLSCPLPHPNTTHIHGSRSRPETRCDFDYSSRSNQCSPSFDFHTPFQDFLHALQTRDHLIRVRDINFVANALNVDRDLDDGGGWWTEEVLDCFIVDFEIGTLQKILASGCATDVSEDVLHSAWDNGGSGVITCLNEHSAASQCFVRKNDNDRTYEREGFFHSLFDHTQRQPR